MGGGGGGGGGGRGRQRSTYAVFVRKCNHMNSSSDVLLLSNDILIYMYIAEQCWLSAVSIAQVVIIRWIL